MFVICVIWFLNGEEQGRVKREVLEGGTKYLVVEIKIKQRWDLI